MTLRIRIMNRIKMPTPSPISQESCSEISGGSIAGHWRTWL